jgi:hypothetical protein
MTHQLGVISDALGYVDKRRSYRDDFEMRVTSGPSPLATANAGGTTTTFVCANAAPATNTNVVRNGDEFKLFNSSGVLKEEKVFTVVSQVVAGSTTITFSPAAAANTASGDTMRRVSMDNQLSTADMDRRLIALGFSAARVATLTENDKTYQIRISDDPGSL